MKRTNLMINEVFLEKALQLLDAKTYSETVNRALEETIKLHQIRNLAALTGTGVWGGDLSEMRQDSSKKSKTTKQKRK